MYRPIGDYGAIGNLRTVALVSRAGSIDWLCLPDLDSPSVFGALLDDARGGRFAVAPVGDFESSANYLPGTNILVARFVSGAGETELTDFMPVLPVKSEGQRSPEIFRRVRQTRGQADIELIFDPRFDYARGETRLAWEAGRVEAQGGAGRLVLAVSRAFDARAGETAASWRLVAGDELWLRLAHNPEGAVPCACADGEDALAATAAYWRSWLGRRETGRNLDFGGFQSMVDRAALVLKLLSYADTGAIAAAATTSLPEQIGGGRNWDYRYSWVRDSSFTLQALFNLGHLSETEAFLRWLELIIGGPGAARLQIMYGLRGEEKLPEEELGHLEGYRGSRPVRIGNDAAGQHQHDIYGEVMDAALRLADYVGRIDYGLWPVLRGICEEAIARWPEPDSGIWEVRGGPRHFVHSKLMCWVALDRGLEIAERYGFPADRERWRQARDAIRAEVLERGWSAAKGAFVQAFGSEELDATALLLPLLGFLPFDDPRVASTVAAVERELGERGFLLRYRIGPHVLSPSDIEHGILRGDRRPPHALRRLFGPRDPRRALRVDPPDPRTHFALVCASSSCPPIAVYTAAGLDEELEISARTFVNAGGVRIDRAGGQVVLSRVFLWYAADFGSGAAAVLRFAAPYLYDERERDFLIENADTLHVRYQTYDWRLNRASNPKRDSSH